MTYMLGLTDPEISIALGVISVVSTWLIYFLTTKKATAKDKNETIDVRGDWKLQILLIQNFFHRIFAITALLIVIIVISITENKLFGYTNNILFLMLLLEILWLNKDIKFSGNYRVANLLSLFTPKSYNQIVTFLQFKGKKEGHPFVIMMFEII